ncbi:MAG: GNAT family N-acetyltransferase [Alkalispirochaeta sp.]
MLFNISTLVTGVTFLLYVAFVVFGFTQHKINRIQVSFFLYMMAMAVWSAGSFMMHGTGPTGATLFWNRFMLVGLLAVPITFFHSLLDLVDSHHRRWHLVLGVGYAIWFYLVALNFRGRIVNRAGFIDGNFVYSLGDQAYLAYVLSYAYLVFAISMIARKMYRADDPLARKKLTPPLVGGIVLLLGVMVNLDESIGRYPIDVFAGMVNGVLIFYSIYKFRLVHYSQLVLQGIVYFLLSVFAAFLFSKIMWVISPEMRLMTFEQRYPLSLVIAVVSALIFQPVLRGAVRALEKLFFGKRLSYYRSLQAFSAQLTSLTELETLVTVTMDKIRETFEPTWGFIVVHDYRHRDFRLSAQHGLPITADEARAVSIRRDAHLFQYATVLDGVLPDMEALRYEIDTGTRSFLLSPQLVVPMQFRDRINGYLVLGRQHHKEYYDQLDIDTLQIFIGQCSIALENAVSFERLKRQQKRLQKMNSELVISNSKLEAFFDGITAPISLQDINYNIVLTNTAAARTFGHPASKIIGKKCYQVYFGRERPCTGCMAQDSLHTNLPFTAEIKQETAHTTYSTHFYPITVPDDSRKLFLEFFQDVTEQKRLREEIVQSAKLAGIGTLASGIAHEINNPLTAISATAEVMLEEAPADSPLREYIDDILRCSEDAATIIKDLKSYSRRDSGPPGTTDLREAIESALKMAFRGLDGSTISVSQTIPEDLEVVGNPNELRQVFLNLFINAIQAMDGKGTLAVEGEVEHSHVRVRVTDSGVGIPEDQLHQLFTPFFTTKPPGEGTGLGLSVAYQIINKIGGRILVASRPGAGTTMTLLIPLSRTEHNAIRFVQARTPEDLRDVFFLQRKILIGEKAYREETIHRPQDDVAFHVVAYKGLQPVGTVTCVMDDQVKELPIVGHFPVAMKVAGSRPAAEIDRLAVLKEERGGLVPLGLMMLAYMHAKARGAGVVFLDVFADDTKQTKMYRKVGFEVVGSYQDPLDVQVMMLRDRLYYEQDTQHLHHFLRPLVSRLIQRLDFADDELESIKEQAERILLDQQFSK